MYKPQLCAIATALALTCTSHAAAVPVQVDGTRLSHMAHFETGTTYLPLDSLLTALGDWQLTWDKDTQTAVATHEEGVLIANPQANTLTYNGNTRPAQITVHQGTLYAPIRTVLEVQNGNAEWDSYLGGVAITSPHAPHDASDAYWLSRIISAESQGEPFLGQIAVGNVVQNRVTAPQFPSTIPDVIFDTQYGVQFEPLENGTLFHDPTPQAQLAATQVLSGTSVMGDALYFYAPALSPGHWIRQNRTYYQTLGCHDFYL